MTTFPHCVVREIFQNIWRSQQLMIPMVFVSITDCLSLSCTFLKEEEWWNKICDLPLIICGAQQLSNNKCWVSWGSKAVALQRGVSRSSSVTKVSLMCPPFISRGSQGMPFSIVTVFSHLSSVSSISDGPLFFLLRCRIPDKTNSVIATMTMQNITPNIIIQMGTDGSVGGARVEGIFKNSRVWSFKKKALLIRFLFILMADCTSSAGRVWFFEGSVTTNQNDTRWVTLQSKTWEISVVSLLGTFLMEKATMALKRYSSFVSQAYALSPRAVLMLSLTLKAFSASWTWGRGPCVGRYKAVSARKQVGPNRREGEGPT